MILGLTSKPLIHIKFTFVWSAKKVLQFYTFVMYLSGFPYTISWRDFLPLYILALFVTH